MILKRDVILYRLRLPAPDALATAIADHLRRNGCAIRRVEPGLVEFDCPARDGAWQAISSGAVWIDPAAPDRRLKLALKVNPLQFLAPVAVACASVLYDLHPIARLIILLVVAALFWVHLDGVRSWYEALVDEGVRRA